MSSRLAAQWQVSPLLSVHSISTTSAHRGEVDLTDALVFGYFEGKKLRFAAKTRNGVTSASRAELMRKFAGLETGRAIRVCGMDAG